MKKPSAIRKTAKRRSLRRWLSDARTCAVKEIRTKPVRYGLRFICCLLFIVVLINHFTVFWAVCAAAFFTITILRLLMPMLTPAREVHQWALEEQEHITMMSLTGKTQEELEKLLEYHLKYDNIEEADRISQKLLTLVDKSNQAYEDPAAASSSSAPADSVAVIEVNSGALPGWLQDDDKASGKAASQKLPDWMK
jgi:hypothetical protein